MNPFDSQYRHLSIKVANTKKIKVYENICNLVKNDSTSPTLLSPTLIYQNTCADDNFRHVFLYRAIHLWSAHINLKFTRVYGKSTNADVDIGFYKDDHGDYYAFDGPGKTNKASNETLFSDCYKIVF